MLDELMEKYEKIIEESSISDWRASDKLFGSVLLYIVVNRHKDPKIKDVPLEDIKITRNCFYGYENYIQEIAKLNERPGNDLMKEAMFMLNIFREKGELIEYDSIFRLNTNGELYKILENE